MTMPDFYDPTRVGTLYTPDVAAATAAGRAAGLPPAADDEQRTLLVLVDAQVDFIHEDGALSVPGAVADTRRTIEWLFENAGRITTVAASLDTHTPMQIFYPGWWVNAAGEHPAPFTLITAAEVAEGVWRPTREADWSVEYVAELEAASRKVLTIWPYHTMLGTPGHALSPALYEAVAYHTAARASEIRWVVKGSIPRTEHYSLLEPEVKVPEDPLGTLNLAFVDLVREHDRVYIAGQAKSHCVLETTRSLVDVFGKVDPSRIGDLYLLTDAMSSVAHPAVNFEAQAVEAFAQMRDEHGLHLTTTRAPVQWASNAAPPSGL